MRPEETVDYHIKSSWHSISRMYNQLGSAYDLTQATGYVLLIIDEEGTPATKIGPMMGMEATGMSRILKSMENDSLIFRVKDDNDGRRVKIYLTKSGLEKQKIVRQVVRSFNDRILKEIGEREFDAFKNIIQKVHDVVDEYKQLTIDKL